MAYRSHSTVNHSSQEITATGSTTARSLASRFSDVVNVKDFGARGDGSTDDTAAIQAAVDAAFTSGAPVLVPTGTYLVDGIKLRTGQQFTGSNRFGSNATRAGVGAGATILKARDTSTVAVIEIDGLSGTAVYQAIEIGNLVIHGPGGPHVVTGGAHGIYAHDSPTGGHFSIWVHDVDVAGVGGRGVYMPEEWNTTLDRVGVDNCGDNGIEIQGGNTTVLTRCYAHRVAAGKAGYRIYMRATLIACNGIDLSGANADWGVFGKSVALGDDDDVVSYITLINSNVEDFLRYGLEMRKGGALSLYNTAMWAPATGTVTAIMFNDRPLRGNVIDGGTSIGTKGATWANGYAIHASHTPFIMLSESAQANYWFDTGGYAPVLPIIGVDQSDQAIQFSMVKVGGSSGSRLRQINTGSIAWTPGTIANGASASVDITSFPFASSSVLSAGGYSAAAGFSLALPAGVLISAAVVADNTVRVTIGNLSGGPVTLGAGTARSTITWGG